MKTDDLAVFYICKGINYILFSIVLDFCDNSMDDCDENADCADKVEEGFTCECKDGFQDMLLDLPGRICGN